MSSSRPRWCRLDVNYADHPKLLALKRKREYGPLALWPEALAYAAQHLTDGWVPLEWPQMRGYLDAHCQRLVDVGLWIPLQYGDEEGWLIKDWEHYQPTRDEWLAVSEKRRKAARARWDNRPD